MEIISILIPIFLVMGLGALSVFFKIFSVSDSYIFSRYDFYIGFPILIFYSLLHTDFGKIGNGAFLAANVFNLASIVILVLLFSYLFKVKRKLIGMLLLAGIFGNIAYMGIPLNEMLFGKEGAGYASAVVGIVSIFCFSIGIFFLEFFSSARVAVSMLAKNLIKNPIIIGTVLGMAASALSLQFPAPLENFLSFVSKSASPIALFAVGMFLAQKFVVAEKGIIIALCFLNLIALPLMTLGIGQIFGLSGTSLKVSFLQAAMPLAVTNFVIAQKYKLYENAIASAIVISTILSVLTIALAIFFLGFV